MLALLKTLDTLGPQISVLPHLLRELAITMAKDGPLTAGVTGLMEAKTEKAALVAVAILSKDIDKMMAKHAESRAAYARKCAADEARENSPEGRELAELEEENKRMSDALRLHRTRERHTRLSAELAELATDELKAALIDLGKSKTCKSLLYRSEALLAP